MTLHRAHPRPHPGRSNTTPADTPTRAPVPETFYNSDLRRCGVVRAELGSSWMKLAGSATLALAVPSLAPAAGSASSDDRAAFELYWSENGKEAAAADLTKEQGWAAWEWGQAQFSLGFCSAFIRANEMESLRHLPRQAELQSSRIGRFLLAQSEMMFRAGMRYRSTVTPTTKLCRAELASRARTLESLSRP